MAQLTEQERKAQKFYATRAIRVRFDNQVQGADSIPFYDNQWRYKMKRLSGYTPQYWENKLKSLVKEWGPRVIECSLHDVADGQWPNQQNRIAQLVTNGHFLF